MLAHQAAFVVGVEGRRRRAGKIRKRRADVEPEVLVAGVSRLRGDVRIMEHGTLCHRVVRCGHDTRPHPSPLNPVAPAGSHAAPSGRPCCRLAVAHTRELQWRSLRTATRRPQRAPCQPCLSLRRRAHRGEPPRPSWRLLCSSPRSPRLPCCVPRPNGSLESEIVGRHHDPFTVMAQFERPLTVSAFSQPLTDIPGALLARVIGAVAAYNTVVLLSFPLSAAAAFLLARYLSLSPLAATVAALAFAFSPFHMAQACLPPFTSRKPNGCRLRAGALAMPRHAHGGPDGRARRRGGALSPCRTSTAGLSPSS